MRMLGCLCFVLASCGLPGQLASVGSPVPGVSAAPATASPIALSAPTGACGPEVNHCIRPGTWFYVDHVRTGAGIPATPVHEAPGDKWVDFEQGEEVSWGMIILRTEVAVPAKVKRNDALVVWRPHDGEPLYPTSEQQAQTRSRWLLMIVDSVDLASGTFKMDGGPDIPVPLAAARAVVERREIPRKK